MGIIMKQSLRTSVLSYLGIALGYVNVVLLFPVFLSPEEFGLTRVILAIVTVASQFALLGAGNSIIRFFPEFKDPDSGHKGLLGLGMAVAMVGFILAAAALLIFKPAIVAHYSEKSPLISEYFWIVIPFLGFEVLFQVFRSYSRALLHAVINISLKEVLIRILTLAMLIIYHQGWLTFDQFIAVFVGQYVLITVLIMIYLIEIGEFRISLRRVGLSKDLRNRMVNYSLFTILAGTSALFVMNIDVLMIQHIVGLDAVAFYAVAFYVVSVINVPRNAINNIALPIISAAWKDRKTDEIQSIYRKSSVNQLAIGLLLFIGIWANHEWLFALLPEVYSDGKWVLFWIGVARLIDVSFGVNGGILAITDLYRWETWFGLGLVVASIVLNLIMIPIYGIVGAAIATGLSLALVNLSRYILIKIKLGIGPFTGKTIVILAIGAGAYFISTLVPEMSNPHLDLVVRSAIIVLIYVPLAFAAKVSEDANAFVKNLFKG